MYKIAVIICNWNKKEKVIKCIDSLLKSTFRDFDVYIVDNGSTDGSAEEIATQFGDKVNLIINKENKGGAGGFNSGIKYALEQADYSYLHLLDNDTYVTEHAIEELLDFMEDNPLVGAAGSKINQFNYPSQLQELGATIDWESFYIKPHYKNCSDNPSLPLVLDCDYVPACSVMIRVQALQRVGLMDEGCFIYWDDIDWFYRFKMAGYRVVGYSSSQVFHEMGVANRETTFGTYYFWRNRINFFAKYANNTEIVNFSKQLFDEAFQGIYFSLQKKEKSSAHTILMALNDAFNQIRGRAPSGRIVNRELLPNQLELLISEQSKVNIFICQEIDNAVNIIHKLIKNNPNVEFELLSYPHLLEGISLKIKDIQMKPAKSLTGSLSEFNMQICEHIKDVKENLDFHINCYVDQFGNIVSGPKELKKIMKYQNVYMKFKKRYQPIILEKLYRLKEGMTNESTITAG